MRGFSLLAGAAALFASSVVAQVDPIVIKGSKFFYKTNGTQFFIRGIAYQQDVNSNGSTSGTNTFTDPLAQSARCQVDIPLMKQLQTNTIRVYAIDPTQDHSTCMNLLQENDIYVIADLSEPGLSINRDSPAWNDELYTRYTSVIDSLQNYTNVIGFFAGNEVSNNDTNTGASAFVKAAVRDMKAYIKAKGYRTMGVGYATNDDATIRENMANYFNCGDQDDAIDFWGYNIYSWCGDSSYTESGYNVRVAEFSNYSVPSFFAEYGCNTVQPRKFTEVQALFGDNMTSVFSGGIVYMWFEETNNYGLVDISGGGSPSLLPDFTYLSSEMAAVTPTGVNSASYTPSNSPQACPAVQTGVWEAKSSPLPPIANPALCSCMYSSLSCVVKSTVNETDYGKLFAQVCGYGSSCAGIAANASTGNFGAYSVCNSTEQLAFAFNQYYNSQNQGSSACNFGGSATIKSASTASSCGSLLNQAGSAGTGTVTSAPSGTAASSSTSHKSAGALTVPRFDFALLPFAIVTVVSALFGAGMILL